MLFFPSNIDVFVFYLKLYSSSDNIKIIPNSCFNRCYLLKEIHLPTFTYPSVDANNNLWFSNTNYNSSFPGLFIYDGKEMQYKFSYDNILLPPRHSKYLGLTGLRFSPNDKFAVAFVKDKKFVNTIPLMEDRKIAKA